MAVVEGRYNVKMEDLPASQQNGGSQSASSYIRSRPSVLPPRVPPKPGTGDDSREDRNSLPAPGQNKLQREFMHSIVRKRVTEVQVSLKQYPDLRLHLYTDNFGLTALQEAVLTDSMEIVDALVDCCEGQSEKCELVSHALLYAVKENMVQMTEHLLNLMNIFISQKKCTTQQSTISNYPGTISGKSTISKAAGGSLFEDAEYSSDITPFLFAARLNHHDILALLFQNSNVNMHPLSKPCSEKRVCNICRPHRVFKAKQSVEDSHRHLEYYCTLASPAIMFWFFTKNQVDPILESFRLCGLMEHFKKEDPAFLEEYDAVGKQCRVFSREMLDLCWTSQEVSTLFSNVEGIDKLSTHHAKLRYPRIILGLHFDQDLMLTHPHCQQLLENDWYDGIPEVVCNTRWFPFTFTIYLLLWSLCLPVFSILYSLYISPFGLRTLMKKPFNRFASDSISFVVFLLLIVVDVFKSSSRGQNPSETLSVVQWLILAYMFGALARFVKVLYRKRVQMVGRKRYCGKTHWQLYDMGMLVFFAAYIVLRIAGIVMGKKAQAEGEIEVRFNMKMYHPSILAECAYAVAIVLAFGRLNTLFLASSYVGPLQVKYYYVSLVAILSPLWFTLSLQVLLRWSNLANDKEISLRRMVNDVLRFMLFFVVVISAFVLGLTKLYAPYKGAMRDLHGDQREQHEELTGVRDTYKTLFWSIFGYGDPVVADVVVGYNSSYTDNVLKHKVTEAVGYTLLGAYHLVVVIVFLNMLIAMMANSYNSIEANSDVEWKVSRTQLRMSYFTDVGSLPPPFNLLPFQYPVKLCKMLTKHVCGIRCGDVSCLDNGRWKSRIDRHMDNYNELMSRLFRRYWSRQRHSGSEGGHPVKSQEVPRNG